MSEPEASAEYERGYQLGLLVARRRTKRQLRQALVSLTPVARSEFEWGTIDALADVVTGKTA